MVGIKAAVAHPAAKDEIAAGDPVSAIGCGIAQCEHLLDALRQFGRDDLIGVEKKNPVTGAVIERDVFLLAVAGEWLVDVNLCAKGFRDGDGAVARAGIDDDEFVGPADTFQGAGKVSFLIESDHGHGERGARRWSG